MAVTTDKRIKFEGRDYYGARKVGFDNGHFVVDLWTTPPPEPRGGYFTCLPISPREFRLNVHKTKAAFRDDGSALVMFSDWGAPSRIETDRTILDQLVAECREQEIPEVTELEAA